MENGLIPLETDLVKLPLYIQIKINMKESIKKEFHFLFSFKFSQLRNGKGHYTFLNGVEYTGDYVENKKHGFAKVTYKKYGTYFGNSHSFNYLSF